MFKNYQCLCFFLTVGKPLPEQRPRQRQVDRERRIAQLPRHVLPQQRPLPVRIICGFAQRIRGRIRSTVISIAIRVPGHFSALFQDLLRKLVKALKFNKYQD